MSAYQWGFIGGTIFGFVLALACVFVGWCHVSLRDQPHDPPSDYDTLLGRWTNEPSDEQIRALHDAIRGARGGTVTGRRNEH